MGGKHNVSIFLTIVATFSVANAVQEEILVAIYGGGVASATLAQALKGHPHINMQYFDPALNLTPTSFRLLGFDPKVHDALELVGEEAGGAIDRAGWYPEEPSVVIVVCTAVATVRRFVVQMLTQLPTGPGCQCWESGS